MINFSSQAPTNLQDKIKEQNDKLYLPPVISSSPEKSETSKNVEMSPLISMLSTKLDQIIELLKTSNSSVRTVVVSKDGTEIQSANSDDPVAMFIPTPSTEGMKISMADIVVKSRSQDLDSSVKKLTKLNKKI